MNLNSIVKENVSVSVYTRKLLGYKASCVIQYQNQQIEATSDMFVMFALLVIVWMNEQSLNKLNSDFGQYRLLSFLLSYLLLHFFLR